jgi:hypothetical protein
MTERIEAQIERFAPASATSCWPATSPGWRGSSPTTRPTSAATSVRRRTVGCSSSSARRSASGRTTRPIPRCSCARRPPSGRRRPRDVRPPRRQRCAGQRAGLRVAAASRAWPSWGGSAHGRHSRFWSR